MRNEEFDKLIRGNAYRIFVVELEKHLTIARGILSSDTPTPTEFVQVGASFHTIRGGAGFFGLNALAEVAGSLENLLIATKDSSQVDLAMARDLMKTVENLAKDLPSGQTNG
jgi:chemotaxis protein histidine kinase CheA